MKLLIDSNLPWQLAAALQDLFPGSIHLRDIGYQRAPDREVWQYANEHDFAVLTKDADFRQLSLVDAEPPKAVLLCIGNLIRVETIQAVLHRADRIKAFLAVPAARLLVLT